MQLLEQHASDAHDMHDGAYSSRRNLEMAEQRARGQANENTSEMREAGDGSASSSFILRGTRSERPCDGIDNLRAVQRAPTAAAEEQQRQGQQ